jgi:hypothetical protein
LEHCGIVPLTQITAVTSVTGIADSLDLKILDYQPRLRLANKAATTCQ